MPEQKYWKAKFKLFLRFLTFLIPYRKKWLVILILSGLSGLISLINPYLTKLIVDKVITNRDLKLFFILGAIGISVFLTDALFDGIKGFLERDIKLKAGFDLNKKVYKKIQNFNLGWFADKSTGEHLYKINYDVDRVNDFITTIPPQAISVFPRLVFTLGIIFYLNWKIATFSLILAPLIYLPAFYFSKKMRKVWESLIKNYQDIFKYLEEIFSHIYLVKAFGKEKSSARQYLKRLVVNIRIGIKNIKLELANNFSGQATSKFVVGLIALYGIYQVVKSQITLGTLTAIMAYLIQLIGLQGQFASFFQKIVLGLVSCERISQILDESKEKTEEKGAKRITFRRPEIIFKDVSFGYKRPEYVLKDLNFVIEKGFVALAGPSGCGKSTIVNLLLNLYQPWQGDILIEGFNLGDLELISLREQIGVVLQEPFLWNASIEDNIKYAKEKATQEEIIKAAQAAGAEEFINSLPAGFDTEIGENACKLSEGQKQKIAIARALIKRPKILILDEAMSAMDSLSEEKIIFQIKELTDIHTTIVVSHRLSTVMAADLVYFLKKPDEMIAAGPKDLLEKDEAFYNLFAAQLNKNAVQQEEVSVFPPYSAQV